MVKYVTKDITISNNASSIDHFTKNLDANYGKLTGIAIKRRDSNTNVDFDVAILKNFTLFDFINVEFYIPGVNVGFSERMIGLNENNDNDQIEVQTKPYSSLANQTKLQVIFRLEKKDKEC